MNIGLVGAKGGVGTTTTAVLLWLALDNNAALVTDDDGFAAAGLPNYDGGCRTVGKADAEGHKVIYDRSYPALADALPTYDNVVRDGERGDATYLVTQACYLAIRRVVHSGEQYDGIILINQPGRALGENDVARAIGAPVVATIAHDPSIARLVDAGLLAGRPPMRATAALRHMVGVGVD